MNQYWIRLIGVCFLATGSLSAVYGQMATPAEAANVAQNWITFIVRQQGDWGGVPTATVSGTHEFTRGPRLLGYYLTVAPAGYVLVAVRKELAAVKAYSTTSDLGDTTIDQGMVDLLKGGLERMLDAVEARLGPIASVAPGDLAPVLEINYAPAWDALALDPVTFTKELGAGGLVTNYQAGQVLTESSWHQLPPYNNQCPAMGCSYPNHGNYNQNAVVGCVATAGAQLMRYWNWPPWGVGSPYSSPYDWGNMLDRIIWCPIDLRMEDVNGLPVSQNQIDAVARLCHEVGVAVSMQYGCSGSSAYTADMEGVYENIYRYSTACDVIYRPDFDAVTWFGRIKAQCNVNRPVHYRIPNHSIVADGWQELSLGLITRQYHMNYGWGDLGNCNGCNTWYTLDAIFGGNPAEEYLLENIFPAPALGASLAGTYPVPAFPFRYVDQDATGDAAIFSAGQLIQFLPNMTVRCTGAAIRFEGSSAQHSYLYTRGQVGTGIYISGPSGGCVKLLSNGSIVFR